MPPSPPRLALWLLERALPADERGASIRGDLLEEFLKRTTESGRGVARRWYWRQTLAVARRSALRHPARVGPSGVDRRKAGLFDALLLDVKVAVRSLLKARAFTAAAVGTLALGIGAATAVFSVVQAVLMRPLPFVEPARVMWVSEVTATGESMSIAWPDFLDWRVRQTSFVELAALRPQTFNVLDTEGPARVVGRWVTSNFFHVLGVAPALGRMFSAEEDRAGGPRVVVIADSFWRGHFGADPTVLGRTISIDGLPHQIIGVTPAGFRYNPLADDAVFVSLGQHATPDSGLLDRGNHNGLAAVGRLRPGLTETIARHEFETLAAAITREHPDTNADVRAATEPITERLTGDIAPTLRTLFVAVAFLLLLAAVNVASLLVARSVSRRHELSVRAALGCSRWRLVRQLFVESAILASTGGLTGLAITIGLIDLLRLAAPPNVPRLDEVRLDTAVLAFALVMSSVSAVILALFPAVQASSLRGQHLVVRLGRGDSAAASGQRTRRGLMIVEIALAAVLLTGAGLMARTMAALTTVDPGFDPTNVETMRFMINGDTSTPERQKIFEQRLSVLDAQVLARVRHLPGVLSAALTLSLPVEGSQWNSIFIVEHQPIPPRAELPSSAFIPISAGYVETLRMRLDAGRSLDASDTATSMKTAVVNETFARRFFPHGRAVGQRLKQSWPEDPTPWRDIVGVVADVKLEGVDEATPLQVYLPLTQEAVSAAALVVRTATAPDAASTRAAANAIHDVVPNLAVYDVWTIAEIMGIAVARQRVTMLILIGFAGLALLLAAVGLSGVVSHGVTARRREIGLRLALGASGRQVIGLFVGQGVITALLGLTIGAAVSLALGRVVESQGLLFQVTATDPMTCGTVATLLFAVAIVACYLPARRAAGISPTIALSSE